MEISEELVASFKDLADLTAPKCAGCRVPFGCCSKEQCEDTKAFAQEQFGVTLEETGGALPFLGDHGCVVPPHLRPLCSVHVCEMHLGDEAFSEIYFEARERADTALWGELMGPEQD